MKSFQVGHCGDSEEGYSDLQVVRSAAGFYIGTIYTDPKTGFQEPGSRDSDYFVHKEQAMQALAKLEQFTNGGKNDDGILLWEEWIFKEGLDPRCVGYRMFP